ncbi:MAG: aminoglycoside phosphotransferase family protein [Pseudonocardiaceae bacterium]
MATWRAHDVGAAARAAVTTLCPGFRAREKPRSTETSMLWSGFLDGRAVIAKYPIDRRPFWLARARHEIVVYRALPNLAPLPVTVPEMVAADPTRPLIVVTELAGEPMHRHRYLTEKISSAPIEAVLSLLARLHAWRPAIPSALPYDDDYPGQLTAVRGSEINDIKHPCAVELYTAIRGRLDVEIQHGDAHLGNVIRQPGGRLALIDLEFTAWRWPSHDLAMLWVLLGDAPSARGQLIPRIGRAAERHAAFWCSALLVCLREIASHQRGPLDATRRSRLERLHRDLTIALDHIQTYHQQIV